MCPCELILGPHAGDMPAAWPQTKTVHFENCTHTHHDKMSAGIWLFSNSAVLSVASFTASPHRVARPWAARSYSGETYLSIVDDFLVLHPQVAVKKLGFAACGLAEQSGILPVKGDS